MLKVSNQNTESFFPHNHSVQFHILKFGATNFCISAPPTFTWDKTLAIPTKMVQPKQYRCYRVQGDHLSVASVHNRNFWVLVSVSPSCVIGPLATFSVPPSCVNCSHRDSKVASFCVSRYHRVYDFGVPKFVTLGVMVGFFLLPIYTPSPTFHSWGKHSEHTLHFQIHFFIESHLLMCWDQDIPIQSFETWSLACPNCFPPNQSLLPMPILCERDFVLRRLSL